MTTLTRAVLNEMLATAQFAPSAHNTQPWVPQLISLEPTHAQLVARVDPARTLPVTDPTFMDLGLSMGCWVEALSIAATAAGSRLQVTGAWGEGPDLTVELSVVTGSEVAPTSPFTPTHVRERQVDRGRLKRDTPAVEQAVRAFFAHSRASHVTAGSLAVVQVPEDVWSHAARYSQASAFSPPEALAETLAWLRLDDRDPRYHQDGLTAGTLLIPRAVARSLLQVVDRPSDAVRERIFGVVSQLSTWSTMVPAFASRKAPDRVACALVGATPGQVPTAHWVDVGRSLFQLWLFLAAHGLRVSVESQVKDHEVAAGMLRNVVHRTVAEDHVVPFAAFSVGRSLKVPPRSPRLPAPRI